MDIAPFSSLIRPLLFHYLDFSDLFSLNEFQLYFLNSCYLTEKTFISDDFQQSGKTKWDLHSSSNSSTEHRNPWFCLSGSQCRGKIEERRSQPDAGRKSLQRIKSFSLYSMSSYLWEKLEVFWLGRFAFFRRWLQTAWKIVSRTCCQVAEDVKKQFDWKITVKTS